MSDESNGGNGCGRLSIVLFVLVAWALVFGVTVGGKHHEIHCSCERGVEVRP